MIRTTLIDRTNGQPLGERLQTNSVAVICEGKHFDLIVGRQHVSATPEQVAALRELLNSPQITEINHANTR